MARATHIGARHTKSRGKKGGGHHVWCPDGVSARVTRGTKGLLAAVLFAGVVVGGSVTAQPARPVQAARLPPVPDMVQVGTASWYGRWHQGRVTAAGERFDMYGLTAAHKTLPLGTRIRVTNLTNQRSALLRINDRGPYTYGRVLDVSYGAAQKLGFVNAGLAPVRIMVIPRSWPVPLPPVRVAVRTRVAVGRPLVKPLPPRRRDRQGDWLVQIAAVWTQDDAEFEWRRLSQRHGNLLQQHTQRIDQQQSAGREVFRLRIGSFEGRRMASNMCLTLQAHGQDCFVVR